VTALTMIVMAVGAAHAQKKLQKLRYGFATKSMSPIAINFVIPEYLGYFAEEGLTVESLPLGSNAAAMAAAQLGRVEFVVGVPPFQLPLVAKGEQMPFINFFEYIYPFKYAVAVNPDSSIASLDQLRGKKVGISNFGTSEYPLSQELVRLVGIDPKKDISWLAVGDGVTAGYALSKGDIDALFYWDTAFGQIEAAGIKMRYLPLPDSVPKVGGLFIAATPEFLKEHRDWAVGLARGVAKAQLFIQTNPEAAAYAFLQMFPGVAPKGKTVQEQVQAIMVPVLKRMPIFTNWKKSVHDWGYINAEDWQAEVKFYDLEGKVGDISRLYTNDLIKEINNFDAEKVKEQARNFKLPYKS
jgi:NitT/TauT family transport system substrate-binding protein